LQERLGKAIGALIVLSALAGGLVVALGAFALHLRRRAKLSEERNTRQEAIAQRFLGALQELRAKKYAGDLYESLDTAIGAGPGSMELREILARAGAAPMPRPRRVSRPPPMERGPEEHSESRPDRPSH
jgi:hypothetical protein